MSTGTSRMAGRAAPAANRKRSRAEQTAGLECPVCLTVQDPIFPFDCGHFVCRGCDRELFSRADDRCPSCRKPRLSESTAEYLGSGATMMRRHSEIARRAVESEVHAVGSAGPSMFFPAANIVVVDASDFLVSEDEAPAQPSRANRSQSVDLGPTVESVVSALLNAHRVPLLAFRNTASSLRREETRARRESED